MLIDLRMGDCLEAMKTLKNDSIESLVTDPPAGISFMGKDWDHHKGGRDEWISWLQSVMKECFRVLKPGAHGFVWAIPRTSHWTATALENAGFEVRDVVTHVFGSGFPKSHNISKGIDKKAGVERKIIGKNENVKGRINKGYAGGDYVNSKRENSNCQKDASLNVDFVTEATTKEAKQWDGWGTALKPASEHWILIRKPFKGTVVNNVLEHGTGGINIDESRISVTKEDAKKTNRLNHKGNFDWKHKETTAFKMGQGADISQGRFPANFICSGEAREMLDEQSGFLKNGGQNKTSRSKGFNKTGYISNGEGWGDQTKIDSTNYAGDSGGASRFFYCAKSSKKERNAGLPEGITNSHPTIKSQKLMKYLITMITPPGGTVLDPFMGSGSTGVAAKDLGFNFIGIEKDEKYFEIAKNRIESIQKDLFNEC